MSGPRLFLVAGEHSGDALGGKLMAALREKAPGISFAGIGGEAMAAQGLRSLFPLSDIAVMGLAPVIARLPTLLRRIRETADAALAFEPDGLVIIDSPDFTHRVARKVRGRRPDLPVVDYVSPSVWAWRPGRARAMTGYVDQVLALLPFEPAEYVKLQGPACTYVGHPLIERLPEFRPSAGERPPLGEGLPRLLVLPGSRSSVIGRHLDLFGDVLGRVRAAGPAFDAILPTLPHLAEEIGRRVEGWPLRPQIVTGEDERLRAFRGAHAALASSGTVTLELALAGVPTVAMYRIDRIVSMVRPFFTYRMHSFLLPNLVLGDNTIPEFIGRDARPEPIATAIAPLLSDTAERRAQLDGYARLDRAMTLDNGQPSSRAAEIVLETVGRD